MAARDAAPVKRADEADAEADEVPDGLPEAELEPEGALPTALADDGRGMGAVGPPRTTLELLGLGLELGLALGLAGAGLGVLVLVLGTSTGMTEEEGVGVEELENQYVSICLYCIIYYSGCWTLELTTGGNGSRWW